MIEIPKHEQRKHFMPKIEALLKQQGSMTREEICAELGLGESAALTYLRRMRLDGKVCRIETRKGGAILWELGEDQLLDAPDSKDGMKQHTVPARQLGMERDPMIAALFGPAMGVAA